MGVGRAKGADKAQLAAMAAISSPLLETSIAGATGVLVSITASEDIQLDEVETASQMIHEEAHPDATIIWGAAFDPALVDEIKVTIIATGFIDSNGKASETVKKTVEAPVVTTTTTTPEVPVQPVVNVQPTVAPVVTPTVAPTVEEPKVEPTVVVSPAKTTLEENLKKADDMISLMDRYNEDFIFITKKK